MRLGFAAALALALSGCAASNPAIANGQDTPVPTVAAPLGVAVVVTDACSLLGGDQLRAVGFTAASAVSDSGPANRGCVWTDESHGRVHTQTAVDLLTRLHRGLRDICAQRHTMAYWQPVAVGGYPGVLGDVSDERSTTAACRLYLGVTDTDVLLLDYQDDSGAEPCAEVLRVADTVTRALQQQPQWTRVGAVCPANPATGKEGMQWTATPPGARSGLSLPPTTGIGPSCPHARWTGWLRVGTP